MHRHRIAMKIQGYWESHSKNEGKASQGTEFGLDSPITCPKVVSGKSYEFLRDPSSPSMKYGAV